MDIESINRHLSHGEIDIKGLFPHLDALKEQHYQFHIDFRLQKLPLEAGMMLIRGARQYGKSTCLNLKFTKQLKCMARDRPTI